MAILAVAASTSLLAGEEQPGTLELLLAQPITRTRLFAERVTVFVVAAVAVTLVDLRGGIEVCEHPHL